MVSSKLQKLCFNSVKEIFAKNFENSPVEFGLGFGLLNDKLLLGPRGFYWSGAGGSICVMDFEKKLSIGYAMNKMYP